MFSEEKEPKSQREVIIDKSNATNLRLSAFICGLNKYNIASQLFFIPKKKQCFLQFDNHESVFIFVHLRLIKLDIQTNSHLIYLMNIIQDRVPTNV